MVSNRSKRTDRRSESKYSDKGLVHYNDSQDYCDQPDATDQNGTNDPSFIKRRITKRYKRKKSVNLEAGSENELDEIETINLNEGGH